MGGVDAGGALCSSATLDALVQCEIPGAVAHTVGTHSVGIGRSAFNFLTLIIGGGLLGWPSTFNLCGWAGGTVSLCVVCLFAESTMCLMVACGEEMRTLSYEETCSAVWGRAGYFVVAVTCYLMDFGVLVTYWVAMGDLAAPLTQGAFGFGDERVIKLAIAAVMLPACYLRNLGKLQGLSYVNYGLIVFSLVCMLFLSFQEETASFNRDAVEPLGVPAVRDWTAVKSDFWPSLGTLSFTFCDHDSVFTVYQGLKDRSRQRWSTTCKMAMWSTVALMVALSLPIYLVVGDKTASDITTNFPNTPLMCTVRAALALMLMLTWIYYQQVARKYLHSIVMPLVKRRALLPSESYTMTPLELFTFTSLQFAGTLALGVTIKDMGLPMALTGVFAQSMAAFVIPPCLLLTLVSRGSNLGYSRFMQAYFGAVLLFGVVSCTLGVQGTLQSHAN